VIDPVKSRSPMARFRFDIPVRPEVVSMPVTPCSPSASPDRTYRLLNLNRDFANLIWLTQHRPHLGPRA